MDILTLAIAKKLGSADVTEEAKRYSQQASARATEAKGYSDNAKASMDNAKISETNASASADIAKGYADHMDETLGGIESALETILGAEDDMMADILGD